MSNKLEVSDWQLQSFVKKLENHLTNGWEVDDTSVAYYNGLQFHCVLVESEKSLSGEEAKQVVLDSSETTLEGSTSSVESKEVVVDQTVVETPVKAAVGSAKRPTKAKVS